MVLHFYIYCSRNFRIFEYIDSSETWLAGSSDPLRLRAFFHINGEKEIGTPVSLPTRARLSSDETKDILRSFGRMQTRWIVRQSRAPRPILTEPASSKNICRNYRRFRVLFQRDLFKNLLIA